MKTLRLGALRGLLEKAAIARPSVGGEGADKRVQRLPGFGIGAPDLFRHIVAMEEPADPAPEARLAPGVVSGGIGRRVPPFRMPTQTELLAGAIARATAGR